MWHATCNISFLSQLLSITCPGFRPLQFLGKHWWSKSSPMGIQPQPKCRVNTGGVFGRGFFWLCFPWCFPVEYLSFGVYSGFGGLVFFFFLLFIYSLKTLWVLFYKLASSPLPPHHTAWKTSKCVNVSPSFISVVAGLWNVNAVTAFLFFFLSLSNTSFSFKWSTFLSGNINHSFIVLSMFAISFDVVNHFAIFIKH